MKELSIEEKAKRYDKALGKARQLCAYPTSKPFISDLQDLFPELKESEDEKIRKQIISFLKEFEYDHYRCLDFSSWIAWLEKQGEQIDIANKEYWRGYREGKQETLDKYAELEKQSNEEEPQVYKTRNGEVITYSESKGYKVAEPKFHEGDFIKHNKANLICKVISVNSGSYCVENIETSSRVELFNAEQDFHFWTIKDANDGEVLYSLDSCQPFIYKGRKPHEQATAYCGINKYDKFFVEKTEDYIIVLDKYVPATKEQRDLLFQKMKKDGYEWDADEKVLNKVIIYEQK